MPDKPSLMAQFHDLYWDLWPYSMLGCGLVMLCGSLARGQLLMASAGFCVSVWGGIALWKRRGRDGAGLRIAELIVASWGMGVLLRELFHQWRVILGIAR